MFQFEIKAWLCRMLMVSLSVNLLSSCASLQEPVSAASAHGLPTATPFLPGSSHPPSLFALPALARPATTFTPNPAPFFPAPSLPTQVRKSESPGGDSAAPAVTLNNPITGLAPSNPALLERRPMAVKITNYPREVRPQSGLTLADVVFEYYIEWGNTRFIAVIYGNDSPRVGPVRSGRYFDEHVARMYHAYFVFKYADPREYSYFKEGSLADFLVVPGFGPCPPFVVGGVKRDVYNNVFFNTSRFAACLARSGGDNSRQDLRSGFFSSEPMDGEGTASRIFTRYSVDDYNYWEYRPEAQDYLRYQETADTRRGKPESYAVLTDAETREPVTADNVVVLFVRHTFSNSFDQEDEVYHIDLVDSGAAFVFRDGIVIPAYWYRTDLDQPLLLATADGAPIFLRAGVTFFQVIGERSAYSQDGADWRFQFATP
jgi:hypothetical protein